MTAKKTPVKAVGAAVTQEQMINRAYRILSHAKGLVIGTRVSVSGDLTKAANIPQGSAVAVRSAAYYHDQAVFRGLDAAGDSVLLFNNGKELRVPTSFVTPLPPQGQQVRLNERYMAIINPNLNRIQVGCQEFTVTAVLGLAARITALQAEAAKPRPVITVSDNPTATYQVKTQPTAAAKSKKKAAAMPKKAPKKAPKKKVAKRK